ncbi:MAG: hypothetical protein ABFD92_16405 [Planctomycetaceae bacterium]|nr:hypothetical protein [Planctomycetaceae bacterium]
MTELTGTTKHLLLDNRVVQSTRGVRLAVGRPVKHAGNPLFVQDKPWEPRFDNGYPNIFYDQQERLYKCWYTTFVIDKAQETTPPARRKKGEYFSIGHKLEKPWRVVGLCYSTSRDGLNWTKPRLDVCPWNGKPSSVLGVGPHGAGVVKDLAEQDPARRYKMFMLDDRIRGMAVAFSADGVRWSASHPCPEMAARGDAHNNALWVPQLKRWVGITRTWDGQARQRLVARTESEDFLHWTPAVEILRGEGTRQIYSMCVFPHAGVYLGLMMIFDTASDRVHVELAWSPDTIAWQRIDPGTPLIANSPRRGAYDWGTVYAAASPIVYDDHTALYYIGGDGCHGDWRDGCLAMATLRPDGFAGYMPTAAQGHVITPPVQWGGALGVSADIARGGSLTASVLLNGKEAVRSEPLARTGSGALLRWGDKARIAALIGKGVQLKFHLRAAKLYSFEISG